MLKLSFYLMEMPNLAFTPLRRVGEFYLRCSQLNNIMKLSKHSSLSCSCSSKYLNPSSKPAFQLCLCRFGHDCK